MLALALVAAAVGVVAAEEGEAGVVPASLALAWMERP